jgi:hypothetical protein
LIVQRSLKHFSTTHFAERRSLATFRAGRIALTMISSTNPHLVAAVWNQEALH